MGGCGGVMRIRRWWWWGCAFAKREAGEEVWAKNSKPSRRGSISGVPLGIVVENNGEMWWGGAYQVLVVAGLCVREA